MTRHLQLITLRTLLVLAATMLVFTLPSTGRPASSTKRFAIVIGNNLTEPGLNANVLHYADDDALATYLLLREAHVDAVLLTRFDRDTRRLHPKQRTHGLPSWSQLSAVWNRLKKRMEHARRQGHHCEFLFFFSGHGAVARGSGYLILERSRLTRAKFFETFLSRSPASRNHVIIDACKSYFLAFPKGPGGSRKRYTKPFVPRTPHSRTTGFILSTSAAQDSHEWDRFQAGVFSHEVRSALRGAADLNRDGAISYAELGAFLETANQQIRNPRFRPDFTLIPPDHSKDRLRQTILRWPKRRDAIVFDLASIGRVFVETAKGVRVLDTHASSDLRLQLPTHRPLFFRSWDGQQERVLRDHSTRRVSLLQDQRSSVARKGAVHLAFERLFATPLSQQGVARFTGHFAAGRFSQATNPETTKIDSDWSTRIKRYVPATSLGFTVAFVALGAGLHIWANERGKIAASAAQRRRAEINRQIEGLDIGAFVSYGLSGACAIVALTTYLLNWHRKPSYPTLSIDVSRGASINLAWSN